MALSIRNALVVRAASTRPSRRSVVAVRAGLLEDIGNGVLRIFTPLRYDNKEKFAESNFTGKILHHGSRKPDDGWQANPRPVRYAGMQAADPESLVQAAEETDQPGNIVGLKNLINNNFTGDSTEPASWKEGGGPASGWSGDIHKRGKDGFHVAKR